MGCSHPAALRPLRSAAPCATAPARRTVSSRSSPGTDASTSTSTNTSATTTSKAALSGLRWSQVYLGCMPLVGMEGLAEAMPGAVRRTMQQHTFVALRAEPTTGSGQQASIREALQFLQAALMLLAAAVPSVAAAVGLQPSALRSSGFYMQQGHSSQRTQITCTPRTNCNRPTVAPPLLTEDCSSVADRGCKNQLPTQSCATCRPTLCHLTVPRSFSPPDA